MISQFKNLSSWRKDEITLEAYETYTLNFRDTMPNVFIIQNANNSILRIGISNLPRVDSYEFSIDKNTTEVVGRPIGTNNLYIYNSAGVKVKILVFSIEKEFDPQILKNMSVSVDAGTIETSSIISGFAEGVTLPITAPEILDAITSINSLITTGNGKDDEMIANQEEILSSLVNLKGVHLASIVQAINNLVPETTYNTKTNSMLTKLDALIAGQVSDPSGTVYDATLTTGQKVFNLASNTTNWNLTSENITIKKINFIRCIAGTVKVYINKLESDTTWESNMIELQAGDSINDFVGEVTNLVLQGTTADAKADILYQYLTNPPEETV